MSQAYEQWRIRRWETPISDLDSVLMVSLQHTDDLEITLGDGRERRWKFAFARPPAYCNILEEFRLRLWEHLDDSGERCGWTFTVLDSPWIAEFRDREPLVDVHATGLEHYVICTDDDVIEVLSPEPAQIEVAK